MQIHIQAPLCKTGYGVASRNIIHALHDLGHQILLTAIGSIDVDSQDESEFLHQLIMDTMYIPPNIPGIKIWHQFDLKDHFGTGKYIGFPIFELNTFNEVEVDSLNSCDELFVTSAWGKRVIKSNYIRVPTHVVPLGVDLKTFFPIPSTATYKPYVFLNAGKWEVRKGHDLLYQIFNLAFSQQDNVELWLLTNNPFCNVQERAYWENLYRNSPLGKKIVFIPPLATSQDVAKLMQSADCGIFPSRAEGWNLELLEMMACGKPVITTYYSAHTEFCDSTNTYLIDIKEQEPAFDNKWFFGQGDWATFGEAQIFQTIQHMKNCYMDRPSNTNGIVTAGDFSWENSAKKIISALTNPKNLV